MVFLLSALLFIQSFVSTHCGFCGVSDYAGVSGALVGKLPFHVNSTAHRLRIAGRCKRRGIKEVNNNKTSCKLQKEASSCVSFVAMSMRMRTNAWPEVRRRTQSALKSPRMRHAKDPSVYLQEACTIILHISFAVNSEELVRVEEAELHTPLIWLHLRIYWDSVQVEYIV